MSLTVLRETERGLWSRMTVVEESGQDVVRREAVEILHVRADRAFVRGTFANGAQTVSTGAHRVSDGMVEARAPEN